MGNLGRLSNPGLATSRYGKNISKDALENQKPLDNVRRAGFARGVG
jgi:hypothetical protein